MRNSISAIFMCAIAMISAQTNQKIYDIVDAVSSERIQKDVQTLVNFGTRNTFSDTISETRGIGAARRWIKSEFELISSACDNCLDVFYQKNFITKEGNFRISSKRKLKSNRTHKVPIVQLFVVDVGH